MPIPWTVKHRPKTLSDVAGNKEPRETFVEWLKSWGQSKSPKKAALLHGPPGTGKTVTVEAAAKDFGFDLVEVNASDNRSGDQLRRIAGGAAVQGELFGRKRLVLLDEIDGINLAEDTGAVAALVEIIESARCPVVLIANDPWDPKIRTVRDHCVLVEFKRLGLRDSIPYLKALCAAEGVEVDEKALRLVVDRNHGDMRSIVNDLQMFSIGKNRISYSDVEWLAWRDRKESIFDALRRVFSSRTCDQARRATDIVDMDLEMFFEWIYENAPLQLTDPKDLENAMRALSRADLFMARMKRRQAWQLLPFAIDQMTAGVAMAKEKTRPGWTPMRFPSRIMSLSRTRKERALRLRIGQAIGQRTHLSSRAAEKHFLPYVSFMFRNNPEMISILSDGLGLDEEMVQYLSGNGEKETKEKKKAKAEPRSRRTTQPASRRRKAAAS